MAQVINTNMASLNAQRNLSTSQSQLQVSLQRLSSGLRINSAKDDAAGMAISSRMTSQINGLNQAARNANDGISLAQTAEGSLNAISDNLQRMRELSVQSANATNSASDRATLQNEVSQLASEIQRVASGAEFNGVKLLDGSFTAQTFQVGANATANDRITVDSISSARTSDLGQSYGATVTGATVDATGIVGAGAFTIAVNGGTAVDVFVASGGAAVTGSAKDIATAINKSNITGVTATANETTKAGTYGATGAVADGNITLTINGTAMAVAVTNAGIGANNVAAAYAAIQANSAATGVTATVEAGNTLKLHAADGRNIDFAFADTDTTNIVAQDVGLGGVAATTFGSYSLDYVGKGGVIVAGTATDAAKGAVAGSYSSAATGVAVSAIDIGTVDGANKALASLDSALATINTSRAALGAFQNRFMSAVSNLQTTAENLTASRSRIQDADFAVETASMTRGQILQQAGTAILAQANSLPNSVLSLLK
ncbi:MAG: flagellin [Burkholderiales bacterium]|nr:flagellin [Burkholderiales bacterium]